ncbi:Acyl-CoA dehydrogenase, short-chain specific [uncultured Rubrobacteraceae bacterium]|uniref:Acyl-CoA dehydrogenase, short-chain specific n=1 Tax=uncultured Rubrobacteraceae bacterium TaxID=349277 RepID=A0A6J4QIU3_9ACTN|nr:Acyl-CoA dehydrogenase, short-chain specific [uncultured Rubrobacteraceae bacterium]
MLGKGLRLLVAGAAPYPPGDDAQAHHGVSDAKLRASDVAMKVTVDALQIHGAGGYSRDLPLERYVREAKLTQIYEGTDQIQREVLARQLSSTVRRCDR